MTESTQDEDQALASEGQASQPEGDGPVTLEDRTKPGGAGSPDTNQGKAEPLSPQPDHPEPLAVPELSDMNVGAGDPQAPTRPGAGDTALADTQVGATRMGAAPPDSVPGNSSGQGDAKGVPTSGSAPAPGTSENQPKVEGIRLPEADDPGPE